VVAPGQHTVGGFDDLRFGARVDLEQLVEVFSFWLLLVHLVDTFSGCGSVFSVPRADVGSGARGRAVGSGARSRRAVDGAMAGIQSYRDLEVWQLGMDGATLRTFG